jgi:uncharacterized protein YbjT (DUF2867 family)/peroxiredoxin
MRLLSHAVLVVLLVAGAAVRAADIVTVSLPGHKAIAPEIAVAGDGAISIVWLERTPEGEQIAAAGAASKEGHTHLAKADVWFARSTNGGATFTAPVKVNRETGSVWGFAVSKPRVRVSPDGVIHVFYPANSVAPKSGKPIVLPMYTRSTDNGRNFAAPITLGAVPDSDNSKIVSGGLANAECFGTLTTDDRGGVFAYWIDTRDMSETQTNGKIFSAVSTDNGASFSRDFEVFPADACPCCQITATTHDGKIYLGSRQASASGHRDSVIAVSTDRGRSFSPRVRWGGAAWAIEGCPLKPTTLAVDGDNVYAAAFNGGAEPQGAYVSRSSDGGRTFEPAVALHRGAAVSDAPVLALLDGRLVAAWHAKTGADRRIYMSVSQDQGRSFSAPVEVPAPAGAGIHPAMALRAGGIQLAWQQGDTIVTRFIAPGDAPLGAKLATRAVTPDEFASEIAAHRGRVVMLNVWATWCVPCLKEIPDLMRVEADLADQGLTLLGLSIDDPADAAAVEAFHQKHFAGFRTLTRAAGSADALVSLVDPAWNEVVPTTYLIGRDGQVISRMQGKKTFEEFRDAARAASTAMSAQRPGREILVLGGTGALGAEIAKLLVAQGVRVTVFTRPGSERVRLQRLPVSYVEGDLTREADVAGAFRGRRFHAVISAVRVETGDTQFYATIMGPLTIQAKANGVAHYIHSGAVGAGANAAKFGGLGWEKVPGLLDRLKDQGVGEDLLRASGVPYTIIRNTRLWPDGTPPTGKAELTEDDSTITPMTRTDLARLTVQCLDNPACLNKTFHVRDTSLAWPPPAGRPRG